MQWCIVKNAYSLGPYPSYRKMVKKSDVTMSKNVRWLSFIDLFFIAKMCFAKYMTVLYTVYMHFTVLRERGILQQTLGNLSCYHYQNLIINNMKRI